MRNLINILDLSPLEIDRLIETAGDIRENPEKYREVCRGKTLATLFFEPSTRTRLSFEAAMYGLGGNVLGFSEPKSSSAAKGESVRDTAKIVSYYSDIIAMRHYAEGAPYAAADGASVPIINAGDGGHFHPTQTLTDLYTIKREKGRFDGLTIGICGDLKYGRTVHSLISAMTRYGKNKFVLIAPKALALPQYVKNVLDIAGAEYVETDSLDEYMRELDVLYMTRIQRERLDDGELDNGSVYVLTPKKLVFAKPDMCVLHPLPRVDEISVKVDDDRRAKYFEQAENGKFIRMALILMLLEEKDSEARYEKRGEFIHEYHCKNPKCITVTEQELKPRFYQDSKGGLHCYYCDGKAENTDGTR